MSRRRVYHDARAALRSVPANARAFAPVLEERRTTARRRMVVETPGGRVTRRPRGVSGERERGARPGLRPVGRARTGGNLQSPRPVPHPPRLSRAERAVGRLERAGGPTREVARHANGQTRPRDRASSPSSSSSSYPSCPTVFQRLPPRLSPQRRETLRARPRRDDLRFLCRSPRKRGGGPRVLGRAARLTEGPLKPRSGPPLAL